MKKTFQKSLVAASVGALLSLGGVSAQADDNVLFPYITTSNGSYTFVSLIAAGNAAVTDGVHYYYMTKVAGAANSAACEHYDAVGSNTQNDLWQFEVTAGRVSMTAFGDTTSTPAQLSSTGKEGFLAINANTQNAASRIYGEATILSSASGLMFSYNGIGAATGANPDFGAVLTAGDRVFSWYPTSAVTTKWYVTPAGTLTNMKLGTVAHTIKSTSNKGVAGDEGAFDNNEKLFSGATSAAVTCFGSVTTANLLGTDTAAKVANGGYMTVASTNVTNSTGWTAHKVQATSAVDGGLRTAVVQAPLQ